MTIQIIDISRPSTFKNFIKKYNIYRDLYDPSSFGIEILDCKPTIAQSVHQHFLDKKELSYLVENTDNSTSVFIIGTFKELHEISKTITSELKEEVGFKLQDAFTNYLNYEKKSVKIRNQNFTCSDVNIVGILNVTPDSFSDGGKYFNHENALRHAYELVENGVDIIDIGGESSRPGAEQVSIFEEMKRVIPVIEKIKTAFPEILISIDTTKAEVAKEAINSGADLINDISALTFDPQMVKVASEYNIPVVLMHMQGTPENMQKNPVYSDLVSDIFSFLVTRIEFARKNGIKEIIIDPGFGFGKNLSDNYELLNRIGDFKCLGVPIMTGVSRKSMLGNILDLPAGERDNGTVITETIAVQNGARFIRTHNVKNASQLKKIFSAMLKTNVEINV